ncbi:hypothetical protein LCGC14_2057910, partial [marine sediment metagenome]
FNLLIVDEAHQLYFAEKRVKSVIKRVRPQKQILLTGTPSPFIRRKYPVIPVTVNHLLEVGMVEDVLVELASSTYNFTEEDYNEFYELKERTHIQEVDTRATLNGLLQLVEDRLTSVIKQYPKLYAGVKNVTGWSASFSALHKTMFACKSQEQARQVARYFQEKGIDTALSISDNDIDSAEIERFKNDNHCTVLIVVGRGVLGFNLPELENVVDMTCSHNVDRIFQLMCRVIRKHPEERKKLYFKVVPHHLEEYFYHVMTCVLCLTDEEYFLKYNGRNFLQLQIPVMRRKRERRERNGKGEGKKKPGKIQPVIIEGLPAIQLMQDILHVTHGELNSYAYTTMQEVRGEFLLKCKPSGYWTLERCKEDARHYTTRADWGRGIGAACQIAVKRGWVDECCDHMSLLRSPGYWTKERCIEEASRYEIISQWQRSSGGSYNRSRENGWLEECCAHMPKAMKWTRGLCIEDAKSFSTRPDWRTGSGSAYRAAMKNGWNEECCEHMTRPGRNPGYWTKDRCMEDAQLYRKRSEWKKVSVGAYRAAMKNGWNEECCEHMVKGADPLWTQESCKQDALCFTTRNEWKIKSGSSYNAAARNGWSDECCEHMVPGIRSVRFWTLERCKEDALRFKTRSEWADKSGSAYHSAGVNGWRDDCCGHMMEGKKPNGFWNKKDNCRKDALRFKTCSEWKRKSSSAYQSACRNGWLDECCK